MSFFTRSLFGRTVLVVVLSVLLTQLATTFVISQFYIRPLLERALDDRANHIQTIVTTLTVLTKGQRDAFIRDFNDSEGARIYAALPASLQGHAPDPKSRLGRLQERLNRQVSPDSRVLETDQGGLPEAWISLKTPHGEYWYVTQRQHFDSGFPAKWGIMLVVVVCISVIGVYWGVRRVNKPLRELTKAVHRIAEGKTPAPVPEPRGPQEIRSLSEAFNSMQQALRAFESNRTIMLAGVSHDLRTPLSRLRLGIEMLLSSRDSAALDPLVQDLEEIDRIIDQFLDFARDNPHNWLSRGSVNEVVRATYERFSVRNYPVTLDLRDTPDDTLINDRAIERVVTNLVENALRYGDPPISIRTETFDRQVRLSVLDRGAGIPPQEVTRLMQPFTRRESSRTGHPGAGLGLAIVDRIIRMHGGTFNLLPRSGGGLEARIELPRTPPAQPG
ncbi:MAG: HAMP domain-containing protein [Betaproteobacteria bacterium]|nr:HAMP domain-containing protein [Betaproteobacteria bacterium]MDE2211376.1 HAMP domain-containing protein [Betaproteobacteria bacterium]